jgi:hypothetical protein
MSAPFIAPSTPLRRALAADALTSGGAALLHLAGGASLAALLGLPQPLVFGSGLFMLAYAAVLVGLARATALRRWWIAIVVVGNLAWADACIALWALELVTPTALGSAWLWTQAAAVTALALWQGIGWRLSKRLPDAAIALQGARA